MPYTISYVIRKRQQIDNLNELPKEKRPPDHLIWHSNQDKLEVWLDEKIGTKKKERSEDTLKIPHSKYIEGN